MTADLFRDTFLRFLAEGMTHAEALAEFNRGEWNEAMNAEIMEGGSNRSDSLLDLAAKAGFEERNLRDLDQAIELWQAGWTSEDPNPQRDHSCFWSQSQVMSWYWRAPSKRPGKPGRRYLSTNQAFNAMKKAGQQ